MASSGSGRVSQRAGIAIAPNGAHAYVASGDVSVIDTATNTVAGSFAAAPGGVTQIVISPDGARAYMTTNGTTIFGAGAGVVIVDLASRTVLGTVQLGALPGQIVLAPDGSRVPYVIKAVPDAAPLSVLSTGGVAFANVLANDRIGGIAATLAHVILSKRSATDTRIKLDVSTGAVTVALFMLRDRRAGAGSGIVCEPWRSHSLP